LVERDGPQEARQNLSYLEIGIYKIMTSLWRRRATQIARAVPQLLDHGAEWYEPKKITTVRGYGHGNPLPII